MEIAGMDERINPRRVAGIVKAVPHYYPEFSPDDFAGLRPGAASAHVLRMASPTSAAPGLTKISAPPPATP